MQTEQPVELYIHIPFCVKKCNYCDFLSYAADDKAKERYVEALCNQIGIVGEGVLFGQQAPDDEDDFFTEN